MGTYIRTDGIDEDLSPKTGKQYTLKELQALVGVKDASALIEIVSLPSGELLVVDEEGLLKELPFNRKAAILAGKHIVGNAVVCLAKEIQ